MNISKDTKITNLEKIGCSIGHLQQCMHDKNLHDKPQYTYFGPWVQKGTMLIHTCKGDFKIKFDVKHEWLRSLEVL